jgi:WD40 repeat protein
LFVSSDEVSCVVFDPQNPNILASCSRDETVKIWDITSGSCLSTLTVDAGEYGVCSVSFSPKDNVIAAGCDNGNIHLVDAVAGEVKSSLRGHTADNEQCTCHHYDEMGGDDYESNPDCPVRGHRYVPSPCIGCLLL